MKMLMKFGATKYLLVLLMISFAAYYLLNNLELLEILVGVQPEYVVAMAFMEILYFFANALILRELLKVFDLDLAVGECLGIYAVSAAGNMFSSLRGGTIGKALYLKKKHDLSYSAFVASASAISLMNLTFVCTMATLAFFFLGDELRRELMPVFCFFLVMMFVFVCIFFSPLRPFDGRKMNLKRLNNVLCAWDRIRVKKSLTAKIAVLLCVSWSAGIAELIFSYRAFSVELGMPRAVLIDAATVFAGLVKIVPGNIGVYEGVVALSSDVLGTGFGQGLLASSLIRVVSVAFTIIAGSFFSIRLLKGQVQKSYPSADDGEENQVKGEACC